MKRYFYLFILTNFINTVTHAQNKPLKLWYDKPASQWEETLPLGNGRLGMTA
jgi:alpha-L-fucosidase 2